MSKVSASVIFVGIVFSTGLWAAPAVSKAPVSANASLQKEHNFEDLLVQGKYHFSDEAVTTVEADKVLDALIGVRKDFKDRLELSDKGY